MVKVLVVEDSSTQAVQIKYVLKNEGFQVIVAGDGDEALDLVDSFQPDVVLTDLQMPNMDGLTLVSAIRKTRASLPVVLMTDHGNEDIAMRALMGGAASYIPKRRLKEDVAATLRDVLEMAQAANEQKDLERCMVECQTKYVLENNSQLVNQLIAQIEYQLGAIEFADVNEILQLNVAVHEALDNAVYHGNLELSSELRESGGIAYHEEADRRRSVEPYMDRRVHVSTSISRERLEVVVRDEGNGFDPTAVDNPTSQSNLERITGRGLLLMRTFMDEVTFNDNGTQVTLVKHAKPKDAS